MATELMEKEPLTLKDVFICFCGPSLLGPLSEDRRNTQVSSREKVKDGIGHWLEIL